MNKLVNKSRILAVTVALAAAGVVGANASTSQAAGCVSTTEYQNAVAGDGPADGTLRQVVIDHFDVPPAQALDGAGVPDPYERKDIYIRDQSCDGTHNYSMYYNRVVDGPNGVKFHLGKKCVSINGAPFNCTS